jgi:hypothetical protein
MLPHQIGSRHPRKERIGIFFSLPMKVRKCGILLLRG